jgi:hypothetical protein
LAERADASSPEAASVRFTPSGVISNAHARIIAIGKPSSRQLTTIVSNQPGMFMDSSSTDAICASSQPMTA